PRHGGPAKHSNEFRVAPWDDASCAVTSAHGSGQCIADPRMPPSDGRHHNMFHVVRWDGVSKTIAGIQQVGSGAMSVADPRMAQQSYEKTKYQVTPWDGFSRTVISASTTG